MMRSRWFVGLAAFVLSVLLPAVSQACPMCFTGSERSRIAIFRMTIFMSLLPLGMIGTGVLWLRRGGRGLLAGEFEDRDAYPPPEPEPKRSGAPAVPSAVGASPA